MKKRDLIAALAEFDDDAEVCVGNVDIHFVDAEPSYYDGSLQVLVRDPAKAPYYDIVGGRYVDKGQKVVIHTLSIRDAIMNDPDLPVDYSDLTETRAERYRQADDAQRAQTRQIEYDLELKNFTQHVRKRLTEHTSEADAFDSTAKEFFDANLSPSDPFPKWVNEPVPLKDGSDWVCLRSYVERRSMQWGKEVLLAFDGGDLHLSLKREEADYV